MGRIATNGTLVTQRDATVTQRDTPVTQRDATVTQRDGSVTLLRARVARLPFLQTSSELTDVDIELSVLRTPGNTIVYHLPWPQVGYPYERDAKA